MRPQSIEWLTPIDPYIPDGKFVDCTATTRTTAAHGLLMALRQRIWDCSASCEAYGQCEGIELFVPTVVGDTTSREACTARWWPYQCRAIVTEESDDELTVTEHNSLTVIASASGVRIQDCSELLVYQTVSEGPSRSRCSCTPLLAVQYCIF